MPNHVTTRCIVTGPAPVVGQFRDLMLVPMVDEHTKLPYTQFDFDRLIPKPKILEHVEESTLSEYGAQLILLRAERGAPFKTGDIFPNWIEKFRTEVNMPDGHIQDVARAYLERHPDWEEAGRARLRAILETGYSSWYPWCIANWGTKWNSYQFHLEKNQPLEFTFQTAWNFPMPVFEKLAVQFPRLQFDCWTFDEGWMFAGEGSFNGERKAFHIHQRMTGHPEAQRLYQTVYGHPPEEYEEE